MANSNYQPGNFLIVPNLHIVLKLRGAPLNVYLALLSHADGDGTCFPSYNRIIEVTGYKRRQVIDAITQLVDIGLIEKSGRARKDGTQTSNSYQLQVIHTQGALQRTPQGVPERTLAGALQRTPINSTQIELNPFNSKDLTFKQRKAYAIACEADRALARKEASRAVSSNKGSFGSFGDIVNSRSYVQTSV